MWIEVLHVNDMFHTWDLFYHIFLFINLLFIYIFQKSSLNWFLLSCYLVVKYNKLYFHSIFFLLMYIVFSFFFSILTYNHRFVQDLSARLSIWMSHFFDSHTFLSNLPQATLIRAPLFKILSVQYLNTSWFNQK